MPENQRNFATKDNLPTYADKIGELKDKGAKLVTTRLSRLLGPKNIY
ncbi:MAG: hypothetical protein PHP06_09950 [Clostridia bacterium]|nr:hypothetical protein [Clostridia bacterium]